MSAAVERFISRLVVTEDGHLHYRRPYARATPPHAQIRYKYHVLYPWQLVWILSGRDLFDGQCVVRTCGDELCCHWDHLWQVPIEDVPSICPPARRLSDEDVREIRAIDRRLHAGEGEQLAAKYNISTTYLRAIRSPLGRRFRYPEIR